MFEVKGIFCGVRAKAGALRRHRRQSDRHEGRIAEHLPLLSRADPVAPADESLSPARALRTQPCQRAAAAPSSTAWTRPQILVQDPKALNRLHLPAPATKQEPPTKGTAPELDTPATKFGRAVWVVEGAGGADQPIIWPYSHPALRRPKAPLFATSAKRSPNALRARGQVERERGQEPSHRGPRPAPAPRSGPRKVLRQEDRRGVSNREAPAIIPASP